MLTFTITTIKTLLTSLIALAAATASAKTTSFDISAGPLARALVEFGVRARVSIVVPTSMVESLQTPGVSGEYATDDALRTLLGDACLTSNRVAVNTYRITAECERQSKGEVAVPAAARSPYHYEEVTVLASPVTGSRLRNPRIGDHRQVDIMSRAEIELSGATSLGGLLRYLPAVAGNSTSTLISNGGDGTATVTLRGLPASNTLVLLNGRRANASGLGASAVDLNSIPLGWVERIEIFKGGASAIYGTDAIAGVVNVILRDDVDGLVASSTLASSSHGDRTTASVDLLLGQWSDQAQWTVGLSAFDQGELWSRDRVLSASSDDRPKGGIDKRSSATVPSRFFVGNEPLIFDDDGFRPATIEDRYDYRQHTASIVPLRRYALYGSTDHDIGTMATFYARGLMTKTEATNTLAPTPLFTAFEDVPIEVIASPVNPFDQPIFDLRRRFAELPPRRQRNVSLTSRFLFGLQGSTASNWSWDLALSLQSTRSRERMDNLLDGDHVEQALGARCVLPCVPLNLFGPLGSISDDMLGFVGTSSFVTGESQLREFSATIEGQPFSLPTGAVEIAAGASVRHERLTIDPDDPDLRPIGGIRTGRVSGSRSAYEIFAEALFPLVRDARTFDLDLHLATRVAQYDGFDTTTAPGFTLVFRPSSELLARFAIARGFRAPSLKQLFNSSSTSFEQLNDPCSVAENVTRYVGCARQSDPALSQFLTMKVGSPDLNAETATTTTIGITWQPRAEIQASLDLFRIRARDIIEVNPQYIVNANAKLGRFSERIERNDLGNIAFVRAEAINIGRRDILGADLQGEYRTSVLGGTMDWVVNATYLSHFRDRLTPETDWVDQAGTFRDQASSGNGALPHWKVNVGWRWRTETLLVAHTVHYVGSIAEEIPAGYGTRTIRPWLVHDIQARLFGAQSKWVDVSFGVDNVFDKAPPFAAAAFNDSYDARTYDITGRFLYLRLSRNIL